MESFFQILVLVNGEVDFRLSSICLYYKYNQVDVIFQIKYTTVLQKFFFKYMEVGKVSGLFFEIHFDVMILIFYYYYFYLF